MRSRDRALHHSASRGKNGKMAKSDAVAVDIIFYRYPWVTCILIVFRHCLLQSIYRLRCLCLSGGR